MRAITPKPLFSAIQYPFVREGEITARRPLAVTSRSFEAIRLVAGNPASALSRALQAILRKESKRVSSGIMPRADSSNGKSFS